ncbi:sucrose-6-phosphate hydrolase-like [Danaus plexippus]|uniref:sucrose-6-phosphate hydrolase-like n=1 Tax=Danaus plexippus TaxID=13037 RepID=UPI002AB0265B|nr:sucrose-6-phosphate hydrolase-like [Danaus plexippus]
MIFALEFLLLISFFYKSEASIISNSYFPAYHLAPPKGWMNDPNGFCIYKSEYHLFYQYNPNSSYEPGIAHWGHAKSRDLFTWENLPIAMYPDKSYDKTGVFSGSALVEDNIMFLFYTGNVNLPGSTPDHEQQQALAISKDGINVTKYARNPILKGLEHQPNIRDPKVWKHGSSYYMVLGNSFVNGSNQTLGRALLYKSDNKITWEQVSVLHESNGDLGYMFECPDFFELDGKYVLLFSPQGVKADGDDYKNLFQTGYIIGDFNYETYEFKPLTQFRELDHGHDFYATQTILDKSNNRIVIAWNDMWETNYPEQKEGFTGQMTIPRILLLSQNLTLIQKPVGEVAKILDGLVFTGRGIGGQNFILKDNIGLISISASVERDFVLHFESEDDSRALIIKYDSQNHTVSLDRGGEDGLRRTRWTPVNAMNMNIYVDKSSIELFCGDGEITFSSRYFPVGQSIIRVGTQSIADILTLNSIKPTVYLN